MYGICLHLLDLPHLLFRPTHLQLDYVVDARVPPTEHAFVLGSSEEMGAVVADFVKMDYGVRKEEEEQGS